MKIYTIGFTQKSAQEFFELLKQHGIQRLVDIRLHPKGQLAGFTKQEDLPYFLNELAAGCKYVYMPDLAPTKEILDDYRQDGDWRRYEQRFQQLMDQRRIPLVLSQSEFKIPSCLLCGEPTPEHCHRRFVAERMAAHWPDVEIVHL